MRRRGFRSWSCIRFTAYATITTTAQLRFTDSRRVNGKRYWYHVAALDAAGNRSAFAGPVSAVAR